MDTVRGSAEAAANQIVGGSRERGVRVRRRLRRTAPVLRARGAALGHFVPQIERLFIVLEPDLADPVLGHRLRDESLEFVPTKLPFFGEGGREFLARPGRSRHCSIQWRSTDGRRAVDIPSRSQRPIGEPRHQRPPLVRSGRYSPDFR